MSTNKGNHPQTSNCNSISVENKREKSRCDEDSLSRLIVVLGSKLNMFGDQVVKNSKETAKGTQQFTKVHFCLCLAIQIQNPSGSSLTLGTLKSVSQSSKHCPFAKSSSLKNSLLCQAPNLCFKNLK